MATHRIALTTGSMGGLGEIIAIHPHAQEHWVMATHSLGNTHVTAQIAEQHAQGRLFQTFAVNVVDYGICQRYASDVLATVDPADIPVNSTGITQSMTFKRMTLDAQRNVLATDLDSVFSMTKPLYEGMVERGWGRIINISSVNGSRGAFGQTNYAVVKAGIHGFTKTLTPEYAARGVTVSTILPGYLVIRTTHDILSDIVREWVPLQIPIGRLGRPEEVIALVAFLCDEDVAYTTSANLTVNGGLHM